MLGVDVDTDLIGRPYEEALSDLIGATFTSPNFSLSAKACDLLAAELSDRRLTWDEFCLIIEIALKQTHTKVTSGLLEVFISTYLRSDNPDEDNLSWRFLRQQGMQRLKTRFQVA